MLATLDKFGRVLIPKKFREHLGIRNNSSLNIVDDGNRIIIEPVVEKNPIVEKDGIIVYTGKIQSDIDKEIRADRLRRMKKVLPFGDTIENTL